MKSGCLYWSVKVCVVAITSANQAAFSDGYFYCRHTGIRCIHKYNTDIYICVCVCLNVMQYLLSNEFLFCKRFAMAFVKAFLSFKIQVSFYTLQHQPQPRSHESHMYTKPLNCWLDGTEVCWQGPMQLFTLNAFIAKSLK